MCLAIYRPVGQTGALLTKELFEAAHSQHPHGMGIMWAKQGRLYTATSMTDPEKFYAEHEAVIHDPAVPCGIHFRYATHGERNLSNCHPINVTSHLALIHNGVISRLPSDKERSDTRVLAEDILRRLPHRWWRNGAVLALLSEYLGYSNKVVLLSSRGETAIINRQAGLDEGGCWFSNASFRVTSSRVRHTGYYHGGRIVGYHGDYYDYDTPPHGTPILHERVASTSTNTVPPITYPGPTGMGAFYVDKTLLCFDCATDENVDTRDAIGYPPEECAGLWCDACGIFLDGSGNSIHEDDDEGKEVVTLPFKDYVKARKREKRHAKRKSAAAAMEAGLKDTRRLEGYVDPLRVVGTLPACVAVSSLAAQFQLRQGYIADPKSMLLLPLPSIEAGFGTRLAAAMRSYRDKRFTT